MTKYYRLAKTAKGTILHDDWAKLSFSLTCVADGIIAVVVGESADCDAWASRVKAAEISEPTALGDVKSATILNLGIEKTAKQAEITAIDSKLANLSK